MSGDCNPFLFLVIIVLVATVVALLAYLVLSDALDSTTSDVIVLSVIIIVYTVSVYCICLVWQDLIQVRLFKLFRKSCPI